MNRKKPGWVVLVVSVVLSTLVMSPAQGQDAIENEMEFLSDRFGTIRGWLKYTINHDFERGISDQTSNFSLSDHELQIPGFRVADENSELLVGASVRVLDIRTNAVLPNSMQSFPEYLLNPEINVAYKERIKGDKIWGVSLDLGSPSDRPFGSIQEIGADATAFLRLPANDNDAWVVYLNYSNMRQGFQHIPLPGIAYMHEPSENLLAFIGLPLAYVKYKPSQRWTLRASYLLLRSVHAKVSYELIDGVSLYGGFDWDADVFFRHDRNEDENRLFYYQKSVAGGLHWKINEDIYVDFSAGYNFDRFFFEGEDYDDRSFNRINVGDGPFLALQAGIALGG
ncbi:MAG: hypothetical protein GWP14_03300 [Actinobacteria bacterium]|nr:hypothetical protein [Actinomycetota bacterium]